MSLLCSGEGRRCGLMMIKTKEKLLSPTCSIGRQFTFTKSSLGPSFQAQTFLFASIVLLALSSNFEAAAAEPDAPPLHIVVLTGANFFVPTSLIQDQALRDTILGGTSRRVEFFPEALDVLRAPNDA